MEKPATISSFTYFADLINLIIIKISYHGAPTDSQVSFKLIYRHLRKTSVLGPDLFLKKRQQAFVKYFVSISVF